MSPSMVMICAEQALGILRLLANGAFGVLFTNQPFVLLNRKPIPQRTALKGKCCRIGLPPPLCCNLFLGRPAICMGLFVKPLAGLTPKFPVTIYGC